MQRDTARKSFLATVLPDVEYALRHLGVASPARLFINIAAAILVLASVYWALNIGWWLGIIVMTGWDALFLYWDSIHVRLGWKRLGKSRKV
jgi:hypothetical protein